MPGMKQGLELQQIIYDILLNQIESGIYRYMDNLPTIETVSAQFHVSVDTARAAYGRLKREGYISLLRNAGAKVIVRRDEREITRHIQIFFSLRKEALMDLGKSFLPLFGRAQWLGLKHASPETLDRLNPFSQTKREEQAPYAVWEFLERKYTALGNDLLLRLVWQIYMFFYAPFFSVEGNIRYLEGRERYEREAFLLCRQKDWMALQSLITRFHESLFTAMHRFYEEKITIQTPKQKIPFCWDSYRKPSQRCYSLAVELLASISRGEYPAECFLPSAKQLSAEKGVSVSTVRRAVGLLGSIGAVKSSRTLGARVLPFERSTENCDFTQPILQRRLLDMAESLQLFALSCRSVSELTLSSLPPDSIRQLQQELRMVVNRQQYELLNYIVLEQLAKFAPYRAIRTVYSELLRQLFWGRSIHGMKGDQKTINKMYGPYLDDLLKCLEPLDVSQFSAKLEELTTYELLETVRNLSRLEIPGAEKLLVPDTDTDEYIPFSGIYATDY